MTLIRNARWSEAATCARTIADVLDTISLTDAKKLHSEWPTKLTEAKANYLAMADCLDRGDYVAGMGLGNRIDVYSQWVRQQVAPRLPIE